MRQGWRLPEDGAQRAASNSTNNASVVIGSPDIARGDQRSTNSGSMGWSGTLASLPLITRQYPALMMPEGIPFTVPLSSHSSEALNSCTCAFSHMALWLAQ